MVKTALLDDHRSKFGNNRFDRVRGGMRKEGSKQSVKENEYPYIGTHLFFDPLSSQFHCYFRTLIDPCRMHLSDRCRSNRLVIKTDKRRTEKSLCHYPLISRLMHQGGIIMKG